MPTKIDVREDFRPLWFRCDVCSVTVAVVRRASDTEDYTMQCYHPENHPRDPDDPAGPHHAAWMTLVDKIPDDQDVHGYPLITPDDAE